jgi:HEPN domain-containing protein
MRVSLPKLNEIEHEALNQKIQAVIKVIRPETVICFGLRKTDHQSWSCFSNQEPTVFIECDLLVIIKESDTLRCHEALTKIDEHNDAGFKLAAVVHGIYSVNRSLREGNEFFAGMYFTGIRLFDNEKFTLTHPGNALSGIATFSDIESAWSKGYGLAKKFYHSAKQSLASGRSDLATLQLHQVAEYTCSALIYVCIGYKTSSHSIKRLLTMTEHFTPLTMDIFPCITKEEIKLLDLLEKSYSHVRYSEPYTVSKEQVTILIDRVNNLMETAEFLYEERAASLTPERINA